MLTDPIGLGLENYDGVGRYRTLDNGAFIDATGDLDQVEFDGPLTLGEAVANHPDFAKCVVRTLTRYGNALVETGAERPILDALQRGFMDSGYRVKPLILEFIKSPLFRYAGGLQ